MTKYTKFTLIALATVLVCGAIISLNETAFHDWGFRLRGWICAGLWTLLFLSGLAFIGGIMLLISKTRWLVLRIIAPVALVIAVMLYLWLGGAVLLVVGSSEFGANGKLVEIDGQRLLRCNIGFMDTHIVYYDYQGWFTHGIEIRKDEYSS